MDDHKFDSWKNEAEGYQPVVVAGKPVSPSFGWIIFFENSEQSVLPTLRVGQLLRNRDQALQKSAGFSNFFFDSSVFGVDQADIDSLLSGDSREKFRAGCDRFAMCFPVHKLGVEAPPIVNLSNERL